MIEKPFHCVFSGFCEEVTLTLCLLFKLMRKDCSNGIKNPNKAEEKNTTRIV